MAFDFTVAVIPNNTSLDVDLQYVKAALLYADRVRLISPLAYLFVQLADESNSNNEHTAIRLLQQILPLAKLKDGEFYNKAVPVIDQFSKIVNSKQYRGIPFVKKLEIKEPLKHFAVEIHNVVYDIIGSGQCIELETLTKNRQVIVGKFENSIGDITAYGFEYFVKLRASLSTSYPLFDETSSKLVGNALDSRIVHLSNIEKRMATHAGLASNYIQRLPSFDLATVDEILDIKKR